MPDEWCAIPPDTREDDWIFERIGINEFKWLDYMKVNNRYLDAVAVDTGTSLSVMMTKDADTKDIYGLTLLSEAGLESSQIYFCILYNEQTA